jgi:hypothetical protein
MGRGGDGVDDGWRSSFVLFVALPWTVETSFFGETKGHCTVE